MPKQSHPEDRSAGLREFAFLENCYEAFRSGSVRGYKLLHLEREAVVLGFDPDSDRALVRH